MDSNIYPNETFSETSIPKLSHFSAPYCGSSAHGNVDPWFVYSPAGDVNARERFESYFETINAAFHEDI